MANLVVESQTGAQAKVDTHNASGSAHAALFAAAGNLPEFSPSAQTAAVTPANMVGKITRFDTTGGAIPQTLPAATVGAVLAIGWDAGTAALTINRAGSDVIGSGSVTSFVVPLAGEVLTYHCTTAGRWRSVSGLKPQTSLDARYVLATSKTPYTAAYAATMVLDPTLGDRPTTVATGDISASVSATGIVAGQMILWTVQASGGARTVTLTSTTFTTGLASPIVIASGKCGYFGFCRNAITGATDLISYTATI